MKDFIPKSYRKETITVRFDEPVLREVERIANLFEMSRNELITQCVEYALQNLSDFVPEKGRVRAWPDGRYYPRPQRTPNSSTEK